MEPRASISLPDGLRQSIVKYGGLRLAQKMYGEKHPYVLQRAASVITRFMQNFTGMAKVFRHELYDSYEVPPEGAVLRKRTWFWPRNYFFNYPKESVRTWHQPMAEWKQSLLTGWRGKWKVSYVPEHMIGRPISRYELFCIQKKLPEEVILNIGW